VLSVGISFQLGICSGVGCLNIFETENIGKCWAFKFLFVPGIFSSWMIQIEHFLKLGIFSEVG